MPKKQQSWQPLFDEFGHHQEVELDKMFQYEFTCMLGGESRIQAICYDNNRDLHTLIAAVNLDKEPAYIRQTIKLDKDSPEEYGLFYNGEVSDGPYFKIVGVA